MADKPQTYYLETNVIRSLGQRLVPLTRRASVFTSPLTLIEIVSGMNGSDAAFRKRTSALRAITESGLTVKGDLPDVAIQKAFEITLDEQAERYYLEMFDCLEALVDLATRAPDRASFTRSETELRLSFGCDFFTSYDGNLGEQFIKASIAGHKAIKQQFDPDEGLARLVGAETLQEFCIHLNTDLFWMNYDMTLVALYIAMGPDTNTRETLPGHPFDLAEEVKSRYVYAIDTFVKGFAHRTTEMLAGQQIPHRNDLMDLYHLIYVTPSVTLVTEDKKLRTTLEAISPKVLSVTEMGL